MRICIHTSKLADIHIYTQMRNCEWNLSIATAAKVMVKKKGKQYLERSGGGTGSFRTFRSRPGSLFHHVFRCISFWQRWASRICLGNEASLRQLFCVGYISRWAGFWCSRSFRSLQNIIAAVNKQSKCYLYGTNPDVRFNRVHPEKSVQNPQTFFTSQMLKMQKPGMMPAIWHRKATQRYAILQQIW